MVFQAVEFGEGTSRWEAGTAVWKTAYRRLEDGVPTPAGSVRYLRAAMRLDLTER